MATESEHRQQAEHNQSFLDSIDPNRFPDWAATVAFYKAVHLVEMLFAHEGRTASGSHIRRNNILKRDHPDIWMEYRPLHAFSRMARYWCMGVDPSYANYILRRLRRVEELIGELTE